MASDQQRYWDSHGETWVAVHELLDVQLEPFGRVALDASGATTGERVIDVGCGPGASLVDLATRVGETGSVLGIDLSEPMVARAAARTAALANVRVVHGDAGAYAFEPGAADLVFSRFGVMYFPDPVAAFGNLRRALRPGGRLAFIAFQDARHNPWGLLPQLAVAPIVPLPPTPTAGEPGPFSFGDPDVVRTVLAGSGFEAVEIRPHTGWLRVSGAGRIDEAVTFLADLGPVHQALLDADEAVRDEARAAIRAALALYETRRGVRMPAATWVVTARNP